MKTARDAANSKHKHGQSQAMSDLRRRSQSINRHALLAAGEQDVAEEQEGGRTVLLGVRVV